ncbi:MAG: hypothetical protein M3014_00315 [Chloroflexota bacterium]|nr:hypothetical protein [Chloroflexota bacterium]
MRIKFIVLKTIVSAFGALTCLLLAVGCTVGQGPQGSTSGCWAEAAEPAISVQSSTLDAIASISVNDAWAVGQQTYADGRSGTLAMHWDGQRWTVIPTPNGPETPVRKDHLYAVSGKKSDDVWAVGAYAADGARFMSLAMHWDGRAWTISKTPNPGLLDNTIYSVEAVGPDDVWAAGSYLVAEKVDAHMMMLHWNGREWGRVPTDPASTHNLLTIKAIGKYDIWAAGTQVQHWNGRSWSIQTTPAEVSGGYLDGIAATGPGDVWVVGNDGNDSVAVHWNGRVWTGGSTPKLDNGPFPHEASALAANDVWVVGEYADNPATRQMLLLHWDGREWSDIANPLPGKDTRLMGLTSQDNMLWAVGAQGHDDSSKPLILRHTQAPCENK